MGDSRGGEIAETLVQLVLRGCRADALVESAEDWRALGVIASRMLFWCGGAIYACRCEGKEMRFAIQVAHSSIGAMAHHLSAPYALHLRQSRGISGSVFKHYMTLPLDDETYLDDLVLWLHRPSTTVASTTSTWTADAAYLMPHSTPWISTVRILESLSIGAPDPTTYRRRKFQPISADALETFTRRARRRRNTSIGGKPSRRVGHLTFALRPSIETISRLVADYCNVSYEEMRTDTRKRAVSKARVITTVLATRNGATAAAAARLFNRSRSTLIEQVEHYRKIQPEWFDQAETLLEASLAKGLSG
jgi:Bacterial dnaA protein helix-turn-helix